MVPIFFVFLAGFAINSHNSGGVESASEAYQDIKAGIVAGYSRDHYEGFELNE